MATGFMADHILKHDKAQGGNGTALNRRLISEQDITGKRCPKHNDLLSVLASGNGMVCLRFLGFEKGEAKFCEYGEPLAIG